MKLYDDLFVALAAAGASLRIVNGKLRAGPADRLSDKLRVAIREHRERLLVARCEVCSVPTGGYGTCDEHDAFREEQPCHEE